MGDPLLPVRAAARRSRVVGLLVALLSAGLGAGMIALHLLRLDPELARAGLATLVLLYLFGGLFVLVGVGLAWVALVRSGADVAELERRLEHAPETIASARRLVATRRGIHPAEGEMTPGQHQVEIEGTDGRRFLLQASAVQVSAVLRLVAARCPQATIRG